MLRNLLLAALALLPVVSAWAEEAQKREMRTVWIATVSNIDWPQTKGSSASVIATQKKQLTDMLDGKIARKYGLITDFGKFLDPLADKILVLSALISLCFLADNDIFGKLLLISTVIVIFRELAVTSMRLVTAGCGVVVPANIYGKVKTVSQMFFIILSLAMPLFTLAEGPAGAIVLLILQYALMATMSIMTVISGAVYMKSYWKYINPAK